MLEQERSSSILESKYNGKMGTIRSCLIVHTRKGSNLSSFMKQRISCHIVLYNPLVAQLDVRLNLNASNSCSMVQGGPNGVEVNINGHQSYCRSPMIQHYAWLQKMWHRCSFEPAWLNETLDQIIQSTFRILVCSDLPTNSDQSRLSLKWRYSVHCGM